MTAIKKKYALTPDGRIDLDQWLGAIIKDYNIANTDLLRRAIYFAESHGRGLTTFYGKSCVEQGLDMAHILLDLKLDEEAVAAAILATTVQHSQLAFDILSQRVSEPVAKLLNGVLQMKMISNLQSHKLRDQTQIDRLRKMFLAMVADIRVVLIKLAEQMCIMRGIKNINSKERHRIAQETLDIYAPLANRLGIGQLKWELEDIAFHYTNTETYKTIAKFLAERRIDRENRIHSMVLRLKEKFDRVNLKASLSGRAKHIYSIYLKMQKKHLPLNSIYDYSAVRILVDKIEDCYTALSIVHSLYDHVPPEFDDYIANPKPNGYRSIHTAIKDTQGKHLEIQIRTKDMHGEAEHGVAAHWIYKETNNQPPVTGYEAKITFLRQLLAWQKDITQHENKPDKTIQEVFEDRVYAFTPAGDIIDLPMGSTPLDFAYHIHSELGHRCRGAKINGHIVPLTHTLKTGDKIEILTIQHGSPSRDWLNKEANYLKTARARSKVAQWFNQQEVEQYINQAKNTIEKEFTRAGIPQVDLQKIATRLHFKNANALLSSLGHGSIRLAQIMYAAQAEQNQTATEKAFVPSILTKETHSTSSGLEVAGINDLLTRIARCCKPIPGDSIIGYITQGRGVSIHRTDCSNVTHVPEDHNNRLIKVNWDDKQSGSYYVDLQILAQGREAVLREITAILANSKIDMVNMNSSISRTQVLAIHLTVKVHNIEKLNHLMNQLQQLPQVNQVKRVNSSAKNNY